MPAQGLLGDEVKVAARGEGHDFKQLWISFDDLESARADGASRAKDGNAFHQWKV